MNVQVLLRPLLGLSLLAAGGTSSVAQPPNPVLETIFPPGGQAGQTVTITLAGSALDGLNSLRSNVPGLSWSQDPQVRDRFHVTVPARTAPGLYDLWAVCHGGLSSPRPFQVSSRPERVAARAAASGGEPQTVPLNVVINGRLEQAGQQDRFEFAAQRGQRVIIECWAERIDSRLRAVLEILSPAGHRLAVNRGYMGIDPLIDFRVPEDGTYVVRLSDLVFTGSKEHYYRLDIDTGPRVLFAFPSVVQRGQPATVTLYGWNLGARAAAAEAASLRGTPGTEPQRGDSGAETLTRLRTLDSEPDPFDRVEVELSAEQTAGTWPLPVRLQPPQVSTQGLAYTLPGAHASLLIGITDAPVTVDQGTNHAPESAQLITCPVEVNGQLTAGDERDWYALDVHRGEVFYFEAFAARTGSPADLDLSILDGVSQHELAQFSDELRNLGGTALPTNHLDPAGRWVAPRDGRFLVVVRNLTGGLHPDPRRTYRLSVRREEPELDLALLVDRTDPAAINVQRGGRTMVDILAFRRRGLDGSIRVSARDLPVGVECPDIWLGPGVNRGAVVISASEDAPAVIQELQLVGSAGSASFGTARGGVIVRKGLPNGWGRLTSRSLMAVAGEAPLRILADGHEPRDHQLYGELEVRYSPGGVLDVAVYVDRRPAKHSAPIKLTGLGLPTMIQNQTATIPAGQDKGYLSFYLPPALPPGSYSLAVQAETQLIDPQTNKSRTWVVPSNAVTFDVLPPAFQVVVDPSSPRQIKRGQVVQVKYSARRLNGFINKIHTELASPGRVTKVVGLRGRGVSFVGQIESGTIQIIANQDAPLGQQPFLRLYAVGVLEDQPTFHGSAFLQMEVVE